MRYSALSHWHHWVKMFVSNFTNGEDVKPKPQNLGEKKTPLFRAGLD
jgi:hypothetical protein